MMRAAAVVLFISGVGGALAGPADVRCVQQGLQGRGFDPGGVDGVMGPGTEAAATAYRAANRQAGLPVLTAATAPGWCDAFGGKRRGTGAVTFVVDIGGVEDVSYKFYLLGPDLVEFHSERGISGKTARFRATREEIDRTTGYCVVTTIIADGYFKDANGARSKSRCVPIKGSSLRTKAVVGFEATLYP